MASEHPSKSDSDALREAETEAERACGLVADIVDQRSCGSRDGVAGTSDDDLMAAAESAKEALAALIDALYEEDDRG